ncbi:MAG: fluoride exporter [Actinomycetota bacterium]|jgi:CrcB protein|nr:fluoride exporter [Actinomycetota bacterium]
MSALAWSAFVVAGAVGAVARYVIDALVQQRTPSNRPWGTFTINVTGSFVLGLLTGLALYHGLGRTPKTVLGTGFCGAFTTFSTFTFETVRLAEDGELTAAALNVAGSVGAGIAAAALGIALAAV